MAEKAAHFSFTSEAKPSIFDVIAQNSLNLTLHPALQRIAEFLSLGSPKYLHWIDDYYEEVFLVVNGFLQYYYIKNYDASFAEYFYGLQRSPLENYSGLTDKQKKLSLVFLVVLPYIKRKLEAKLSILRLHEAEGSFGKDFTSRFKKFLLLLHSSFEVTWRSWMLINYLRYMADESESQLPNLYILKLHLVYGAQSEDASAFWSSFLRGKLGLKEMSVGFLQNGIRTSLEISAFFIQFLRVWNNERSTYNVTALPTVPQPMLDREATNLKNRCPICLQNWKIPTALPVSGYVFCFPCILKYLRENQQCPITHLPAKPLDVVRLYDTE